MRAKYPDAQILALRTFHGFYAAQTMSAVQSRSLAGDDNVQFLDTTGWVTAADFPPGDDIHPSDTGHQRIASKLVGVLSPLLYPNEPGQSALPILEDFYSLSDWTPGADTNGTIHRTASGGLLTCGCAGGLPYGSVAQTFSYSIDDHPLLVVAVNRVSPAVGGVARGQWGLKVSRGNEPDVTVQDVTDTTGEVTYDLQAITGWTGTQTITIRLFALHNAVIFSNLSTVPVDFVDLGDESAWSTANALFTAGRQSSSVEVASPALGYGHASYAVRADVGTYPKLRIDVRSLIAGASWSLKVNAGGADVVVQADTSGTGVFTYDLRQLTGWTSATDFDLKVFAIGPPGAKVEIGAVTRYQYVLEGFDHVAGWSGALASMTAAAGIGTIAIDDATYGYASMRRTVQIDLEQYPRLIIDVVSVPSGAQWAMKLDDGTGDIALLSDTDADGRFSFNVPASTGWTGKKRFDIVLYVIGGLHAAIDIGEILISEE